MIGEVAAAGTPLLCIIIHHLTPLHLLVHDADKCQTVVEYMNNWADVTLRTSWVQAIFRCYVSSRIVVTIVVTP